MNNYPALSKIDREEKTIFEFKGFDKRLCAEENTLSNAKNISALAFPRLMTRRARRKVFKAPLGEKITGVFNFDKIYVTTEFEGRTRLYIGDDFKNIKCPFTANKGELSSSLLCRYDDNTCIFNINRGMDVETLVVSSATSFDYPMRYIAPNFTDVTVYKNRVFGCRRRQILACALDDITDWDYRSSTKGEENKAYYKSYQTDTDFTACVNYKNRTLFFTENEMFELYGSNNLDFELVKVANVGCVNRFSLCEIEGTLYFLSEEGLMRYAGANPTLLSEQIYAFPEKSEDKYVSAVGGTGNIIYVDFKTENEHRLYTYNIREKLWSKEDDLRAEMFETIGGKTYMATADAVYELESAATPDSDADEFEWEIETQEILGKIGDGREASSIELCMWQPKASRIEVYVSCNGEDYELMSAVLLNKTKTVLIPIRKREVMSVRVKLCGKGLSKIHYIGAAFTKRGRKK